jgi:hypothetical protein
MKTSQMNIKQLLIHIMENPEYLTDGYYAEERAEIWKRYRELTNEPD